MTKEYLKMSDVFPFTVQFDSDGGIGAVVDSQGEYIAQAMENNYCSHMTNKNKNTYRNNIARYISHSVASHDDLVAKVEQLRKELHVQNVLIDCMKEVTRICYKELDDTDAANFLRLWSDAKWETLRKEFPDTKDIVYAANPLWSGWNTKSSAS